MAPNRAGDRTTYDIVMKQKSHAQKYPDQRSGSLELLMPTDESYVSGEHHTLDFVVVAILNLFEGGEKF